MSHVLLRVVHLCTGLLWQQMCGYISLWEKGGLCKEMQQQRGERVRNHMLLCSDCVQVLDSCRNDIYCILSFRCVITRMSAIVILAGLHLTVKSNMQIYLKVQSKLLNLILYHRFLQLMLNQLTVNNPDNNGSHLLVESFFQ